MYKNYELLLFFHSEFDTESMVSRENGGRNDTRRHCSKIIENYKLKRR